MPLQNKTCSIYWHSERGQHKLSTVATPSESELDADEYNFMFQFNSNKSPTRCKNVFRLLLDVYLELNMFQASSRPSSGAQQLQ